jgi:spermidine/putrescine transport system permease protein
VLSAVFLIFIPVVGSFMEPRILGGKNAIMLGPIIEGQFITAFNWPLGAALSFMMLAIVLVIIALFTPLLRRYARVG